MSSPKRTSSARVEGEIVIRRPVEEVFDYVVDERNEPNFNARMSRVELLTPEPIGVGSRFGIELAMMRRVFDMTVEFTALERPRLLGSASRSLPRGGKGRPLLTAGSLTFDPVPEGTRMRWSWRVETPAAMSPLAPLVAWTGRRQERRVWGSLKRLLEEQPPTGYAGSPRRERTSSCVPPTSPAVTANAHGEISGDSVVRPQAV
jgi:uncharacterized protein YndB with AHSA1/START domain